MRRLAVFVVGLMLVGCGGKSIENNPNYQKAAATYKHHCSKCHGIDGKRDASGGGSIIGGRSASWIEGTLKGYRTGNLSLRGSGAVMKAQIGRKSDEEIRFLAEYISSLK